MIFFCKYDSKDKKSENTSASSWEKIAQLSAKGEKLKRVEKLKLFKNHLSYSFCNQQEPG
jgi:hypothetical protein